MLSGSAFLLFAAIVLPASALAAKYWRQTLFGVFVLLVFEGALRKWAFPWAQAQLYLVKDVILLAIYFGFLLERRKYQIKLKGLTAVKVVVIIGLVFCLINAFNPYSPSALVGLLGLKAYFLYAPIAFILPYAIRTRDTFDRLIKWYVLLAIPVAILGFIQTIAGPESFLNTYVGQSDDAAGAVRFGRENQLVRATGTFSYISGYAVYLIFIAFLAIAYNFARKWRIKNNTLPLISLTLIIGAMFTTGSRGPVYILIASVPIMSCLALMTGALSIKAAGRLVILLALIGIAALSISSRAFNAFQERALGATDSTLERLLGPLVEMTKAISEAPLLGFGTGTAQAAAVAIMGSDWASWLQGLVLETEMARVVVEIGVIGWILVYGLRMLIVVYALRSLWLFKDPAYRSFGIVLSIYLALAMIGNITFDPTANFYFWSAFGLVLVMRSLEHIPNAQVVRDDIQNQLTLSHQLKPDLRK